MQAAAKRASASWCSNKAIYSQITQHSFFLLHFESWFGTQGIQILAKWKGRTGSIIQSGGFCPIESKMRSLGILHQPQRQQSASRYAFLFIWFEDLHRATIDSIWRCLYCCFNFYYPILIKDMDGFTCLMKAAQSGYLPIVNALVKKGVDINIQDKVVSISLMNFLVVRSKWALLCVWCRVILHCIVRRVLDVSRVLPLSLTLEPIPHCKLWLLTSIIFCFLEMIYVMIHCCRLVALRRRRPKITVMKLYTRSSWWVALAK